MGWDGIDEFAARARGWEIRPIQDLAVFHYSPRGSKQNWFEARREEGRGAHYMGYRLPYLLFRVLYRMARETPPALGGLALGLGYLEARVKKRPQVPDQLAIAQLRAEHRARLLGLARLRSPRARNLIRATPTDVDTE